VNPKRRLLVLLFGVVTVCSAQDESTGSCQYFQRDDQTIFVVTTKRNDLDAHFYQFNADPKQKYQDAWSKGVVEAASLVTPKGENKSDGIEFTAKPWPASDRISVEVKNWKSKDSVDGDYDPIDASKAKKLAQTHFDEADKNLNETYQSIVRTLPKPAVETLDLFSATGSEAATCLLPNRSGSTGDHSLMKTKRFWCPYNALSTLEIESRVSRTLAKP
jgi:uncharacterized protein YecT (DUF1311 family)